MTKSVKRCRARACRICRSQPLLARGLAALHLLGLPTPQLLEVLLPLLEQLAQEGDVRPVLRAKFGMAEWFRQRGFAVDDSKS